MRFLVFLPKSYLSTRSIIGKIGIPAESCNRVALVPDSVTKFTKIGVRVNIESGAGKKALYSDEMYKAAGATIVSNFADLVSDSDLVAQIRLPNENQIEQYNQPNLSLVTLAKPYKNLRILQGLNKIGALYGLDLLPRTTRAQVFDCMSSMSVIGGYKAVIEAANILGRQLGSHITAAGRLPPSRVLIVGCGVAGLSAAGTAKSMGAVVRAFDARKTAEEQVKSIGADFVSLDTDDIEDTRTGYAKEADNELLLAERKILSKECSLADIVICSALVPGKPAPLLVTKQMIESMKSGSVIVDMAIEAGGNSELSGIDECFQTNNGVTIFGASDLADRVPKQASDFFSNNITAFINLLINETNEPGDQIIVKRCLCVKSGKVLWSMHDHEPQNVIIKPKPPPIDPQSKKSKYGLTKMPKDLKQ
ncbi:hypothetical protein ACOME3_006970 [Neoechinorhynchus agilis]